ncbi:peptidoglycan-binding domain-containing protein [Nocardiopsis suaedae]|uniref:Peptidoglycan-binding protein n=1 Tax=Nocardiopsis suaedae TaxID=3018444 RepID=A0ABT4TS70_9ACTN|nr:peptidoglycan-binding protein [Nocardiopsis suaedae]MDA2807200.1 peptidoglycan-binding protein [Nocardiopsis suaedae]
MSMGNRIAAVAASGALVLGTGLAAAPAALADGPHTPPEVEQRVEACEWTVLKPGDGRWEVGYAKHVLNGLGAYDSDAVDDVYGEDFTAAVEEYQSSADVPRSGEFDTATWEHARADFGEVGPGTQSEPGDLVRAVQYALAAGYGYDLAVDGYYGPATEGAVREFQGIVGIDADGIVGPITFRALVTGGACQELGLTD